MTRVRLSAIAALALVAFTTTAAAGRLPKPLGVGHQELSAGVDVLDLVSREQPGAGGPKHLPRIAITLPWGWFNYDGWGMNDTGGLSISFWDVDKVYGTPCQWQSKPKVDPGPTVAGLAAALAAQPLRHASVPRDVVLAGVRGKYLSWSEPNTTAACDQNSFESWTAKGWASDRYQQGPGQVDLLWILDVKGQRVVIDASYMPWTTGKERAELDRIVHSIRFLAGSARKTASVPKRAVVPPIAFVRVSGINDRGEVVGTLATPATSSDYQGALTAGVNRGFVWQRGSVELLGRGDYVEADEINERRQVIGTSGDDQHGVLWDHGKTTNLGTMRPIAINERGQIIGGSGSAPAPVLWENGRTLTLGPIAYFGTDLGSYSKAINDRGQVVGETADGEVAVWQDGTVTILGPGFPVAINDRGEILGIENGDVTVWQNGTPTDLGPGFPVAINDRGEVIGYHAVGSDEHGFLWRNGTMIDLGTLGGAWSIATAISDRGQVVGYSDDASGTHHAFVWQNGTMTRLPSPTGGGPAGAVAINDENQIVGDDCYECWDDSGQNGPLTGSRFAVLWTLTPQGIVTRKILGSR